MAARRPRHSQYPLVDYDEALAAVFEAATAHCARRPPAQRPLGQLVGCVAAEPVVAQRNLPPFRASIKDGYAVLASDGPGERRVVAVAAAGAPAGGAVAVGSGEVARVATGAPVPAGADAVVMVEDTEVAETTADGDEEVRVRIKCEARAGQDIRAVGCDIAVGAEVLAAGQVVGPAELGVLASAGVRAAAVREPPVVALFSTGNELVDPCGDEPAGDSAIIDCNRPMLMAALAETRSARMLDLGICRDTQRDLRALLDDAFARADVVVTTGGVSMGELDLLKPTLEELGTVHFGRVRLKPGKPTTFATVAIGERRCMVFALPGNPVSSLVTFHLFVLPALHILAGRDPGAAGLERVQARLGAPLLPDKSRTEFHRVMLDWSSERGAYEARSTGNQASHRLLSAVGALAYLIVPPGEATLAEGALVDALLLPRS